MIIKSGNLSVKTQVLTLFFFLKLESIFRESVSNFSRNCSVFFSGRIQFGWLELEHLNWGFPFMESLMMRVEQLLCSNSFPSSLEFFFGISGGSLSKLSSPLGSHMLFSNNILSSVDVCIRFCQKIKLLKPLGAEIDRERIIFIITPMRTMELSLCVSTFPVHKAFLPFHWLPAASFSVSWLVSKLQGIVQNRILGCWGLPILGYALEGSLIEGHSRMIYFPYFQLKLTSDYDYELKMYKDRRRCTQHLSFSLPLAYFWA